MARESPGLTLQPTALVHEAYLRLIGDKRARWESRSYFFAAAATAMRRILVERARKAKAVKYGGGQARVTLMDTIPSCDPPAAPGRALGERPGRLEAHDERASRIVHLRYLAGLSIEETAELMEVSTVTVTREWTYARAWLRREITGGRRGKESSLDGGRTERFRIRRPDRGGRVRALLHDAPGTPMGLHAGRRITSCTRGRSIGSPPTATTCRAASSAPAARRKGTSDRGAVSWIIPGRNEGVEEWGGGDSRGLERPAPATDDACARSRSSSGAHAPERGTRAPGSY